MNAGLPFAASGSRMKPGRAAASSGGRSVAAAPPTGREVVGGNLSATTSVGRPVTALPRLGREVAGESRRAPGGTPGRRGEPAGRAGDEHRTPQGRASPRQPRRWVGWATEAGRTEVVVCPQLGGCPRRRCGSCLAGQGDGELVSGRISRQWSWPKSWPSWCL